MCESVRSKRVWICVCVSVCIYKDLCVYETVCSCVCIQGRVYVCTYVHTRVCVCRDPGSGDDGVRVRTLEGKRGSEPQPDLGGG